MPLVLGCPPWARGNAADVVRPYASLAAVFVDFGTTTPEYLAAQVPSGRSPGRPSDVYDSNQLLNAIDEAQRRAMEMARGGAVMGCGAGS